MINAEDNLGRIFYSSKVFDSLKRIFQKNFMNVHPVATDGANEPLGPSFPDVLSMK
jgi:hypothetical protein